MKIISKYVEVKFWQILLLGGASVAFLIIIFMIIGFLLAVFTDYGRLLAFSLSTFIGFIYFFSLLFYFPIKLLLKLKQLNGAIKK
jgi:hypothetical protein